MKSLAASEVIVLGGVFAPAAQDAASVLHRELAFMGIGLVWV